MLHTEKSLPRDLFIPGGLESSLTRESYLPHQSDVGLTHLQTQRAHF